MKRLIYRNILTFLFSVAGLLFPASLHAQFLGYTSPQTVSQKIFSGQTTAAVSPSSSPIGCVPVNGTPCAIANLGQSIHTVVYSISSPCTTGFFMDLRIEASNDGVNWFAISEDATDQNSGSIQGSTFGGLTATGSYAAFRLNLVSIFCASGQSPAVTAFYSGTSTSNPTATGVFYQASPYRKLLVNNLATTATQPVVTIGAPTGNSSGTLVLSCYIAASGATTSCPAATITVISYLAFGAAVGGGGGGAIVSGSQAVSVPVTTSPILQVTTAGPAESVNFQFSTPGTAGVNWSIFYLFNSVPVSNVAADPCSSAGASKISKPISITGAGTTGIISGNLGQAIYVCGGSFTIASSATSADSIQFEFGANSLCATGTTILTGTFGTGITVANLMETIVLPAGATNFTAPASAVGTSGNNLCAVTTGTTVNIQGYLSYVQQ